MSPPVLELEKKVEVKTFDVKEALALLQQALPAEAPVIEVAPVPAKSPEASTKF